MFGQELGSDKMASCSGTPADQESCLQHLYPQRIFCICGLVCSHAGWCPWTATSGTQKQPEKQQHNLQWWTEHMSNPDVGKCLACVCVRVYVEWEWWVSVVICFYLSDPKPNSYASTNHINYTHILLELEEAMKLRNKTTPPSHYPLSSMCTIYALLALTCIHSFFTGEVLNL